MIIRRFESFAVVLEHANKTLSFNSEEDLQAFLHGEAFRKVEARAWCRRMVNVVANNG